MSKFYDVHAIANKDPRASVILRRVINRFVARTTSDDDVVRVGRRTLRNDFDATYHLSVSFNPPWSLARKTKWVIASDMRHSPVKFQSMHYAKWIGVANDVKLAVSNLSHECDWGDVLSRCFWTRDVANHRPNTDHDPSLYGCMARAVAFNYGYGSLVLFESV
jgi:hypothetical protein